MDCAERCRYLVQHAFTPPQRMLKPPWHYAQGFHPGRFMGGPPKADAQAIACKKT